MASFLKNILGGGAKKGDQKPLTNDAGFADFADAPDPSPASILPSISSVRPIGQAPTLAPSIPYTKWYRVWERSQISDFYQEMIIAPFILSILLIHVFGMRSNRKKAHDWARHHAPALQFEFASVGFSTANADNGEEQTKLEPKDVILEQKADEFVSYATGRNNVAFLDIKLSLIKRYNPFIIFGEALISFLFESVPATVERMEAIQYSFDNKESILVPRKKDQPEARANNSSYDGFVFAIVNKSVLRRLREDRYDLSLTTTKDHPKLPEWTTVLSESGEITDTIITSELANAIKDAGDRFETLIISDQPLERPNKLDETIPRKRSALSLKLPSKKEAYVHTLPLFAHFLRLPDFLVKEAHFRPEAMKKVKQIRDAEINRIKKEDDDAQAEERKTKSDKEKKEKREALLKGMSADEQRKFLDKEREKGLRKSNKKRMVR